MCLFYHDNDRQLLYLKQERLFLAGKTMIFSPNKEKGEANLIGTVFSRPYNLEKVPEGLKAKSDIQPQVINYSGIYLSVGKDTRQGNYYFERIRPLGFHLSKFMPVEDPSFYFKSILNQIDEVEQIDFPERKSIFFIVGFFEEDFMEANYLAVVVRSFIVLRPELWKKVMLGYLRHEENNTKERRKIRRMISAYFPKYEKIYGLFENSIKRES